MADGEVRIDITADDSDIKKKLDKVEDKAEDTAESLEELGEGSEKAGKGFDIMDIAAGNLVSGGISALLSGIGQVFSELINLADETREFREDMAKLETAFKSTGHETEDAKKAYEGFYAILGESDRSVEAVNHLAELTSNTEELAQWQTIAAGVTAKFGDSLPIEGLTEAANETAKVGQVTGPLADALNWAGISEDKFNEKLKACNSEQQRASLITSTLNGLYADAAAEYNELTAETQAARLATARMEEAQAALGAKMEPLTTAWTELKSKGLEAITPVVGTLAEGVTALTESIINNKSAVELRAESSQNALDAVRSEAEAYRELKIAQFEQSAGDLAHLENARLLYTELTGLVDANGRVSEANKERAEFIVSTLNEALGLELSITGNQIRQYGDLKTAVENTIAAKQAEILLANDLEAYTEAIENRVTKEKEQAEKLIEISEQKKNVTAAETEYLEAHAKMEEMIAVAKTEVARRHVQDYAYTVKAKEIEMLREKGTLSKLEEAYNENEELLKAYYSDISSYEEAQSLIMQGKTTEAIELLNKKNDAYYNSSKVVGTTLDEQRKKAEDHAIFTGVNAALMRDRYEKGVEGVTEAMVITAEKAASTAQTEFEEIGGQIGDGIGKGAEKKKPGLLTKIRGIVSAMLTAAKDEADINSPSKETEWIAEMMMDGFSGGITKKTNQVISDIKDLGGEMLSTMSEASSENIKRLEKEIDELSKKRDGANKEEIKAVEKQLTELSELKNDAYDEDIKRLEKEKQVLSDSRNKNNANTVDAKKKEIDKELRLLKEQKEASQKSINDKKAELQKKLRLLKEDRELTQEQLDEKKEALQEELSIEKEREKALEKYADTFEKQMQKFSALEEKYVSAGAKIFEQLDKDIAAAQKSYDDAFASRVESIKSGLSLFELYEKGDRVKGSELTKNLKTQISGLSQYNKALEELSGKGINAAFVDELKAMGMDALPQLEAINKMSEKQLSEYVALWEEKNALATSAATKEMATQREETEAEIELLKKNAEKDFEDLRAEYRREMLGIAEEIGAGLKESGVKGLEEMGAFISDYTALGESLMEGLAKGIEDKESDVINNVINSIRNAIKAAKEEAGIHSPSKVTENEIGANMALGVGKGWKDKLSGIKNSFGSGIADTLSHLRATVAMETARFGHTPGVADSGFSDLANAVGLQTAGINSLAGEYRKGSGSMRPVILELNGRELGRAVVDVGSAEENRVGTTIAVKGGRA